MKEPLSKAASVVRRLRPTIIILDYRDFTFRETRPRPDILQVLRGDQARAPRLSRSEFSSFPSISERPVNAARSPSARKMRSRRSR
jgi:hypothetical protein